MRRLTFRFLLSAAVGVMAAARATAAGDDFSSNPLGPASPWTFGIGDNSNSQFSWTPGALSVHVDSSLPTARLDLPLGTTLGDSDSFLLTARFRFTVTTASPTQFAQFAFGLTNSTFTGGDRTGSAGNFFSDNTFHTLEFDYYPNVTDFGGPTLSPGVFGAQIGGGDAFSNFASIFGSPADLGDNTVGVTELPQDTTLEAQLAYDGAEKILTLSMFAVGGGGTLTPLATELVPLDLDEFGSGYDPTHPFLLDTLSIMAYQDGFTTAQDKSLVADVTYYSVSLVVVPEPSTWWLVSIGVAMSAVLCRRLAGPVTR